MKKLKLVIMVSLFALLSSALHADVVSSDSVMQLKQTQFEKQQIITMLDSQAVQDTLVALGVDKTTALARIENMTPTEIRSLNTQLLEAPAGAGIGGTIITVLVVVAVLDLMGITDVYPFIDPV